jgi:hypothetical protein
MPQCLIERYERLPGLLDTHSETRQVLDGAVVTVLAVKTVEGGITYKWCLEWNGREYSGESELLRTATTMVDRYLKYKRAVLKLRNKLIEERGWI